MLGKEGGEYGQPGSYFLAKTPVGKLRNLYFRFHSEFAFALFCMPPSIQILRRREFGPFQTSLASGITKDLRDM